MLKKRDAIQEAVKAVNRITDSGPVNGEDLLGSPELKRQLREAKQRLKSAKPSRQVRPSGAGAG